MNELDDDISISKSCHEISTQTEFVPVSISTQTDNSVSVSTSTQTDDIITIEVEKDRSVPLFSTPSKVPECQETQPEWSPSESKGPPQNLSISYMLSTSNSESESIDSEDERLITSMPSANSMNTTSRTDTENLSAPTTMYIVDAKQLEMLFAKCLCDPFCNAPLSDITKVFQGPMVIYTISCNQIHTYTWKSQPTINRTSLGNILLAAGTLYTGNTYTTLSEIAECSGIKIFSEQTFYKIQNKWLFPTITSVWNVHQLELRTGKLKSTHHCCFVIA